jgi:hypothetical protein
MANTVAEKKKRPSPYACWRGLGDPAFDHPCAFYHTGVTTMFFWMATKIFFAHSVVTVLGVGWSIMIDQPIMAIIFALLGLGGFALWLEWRNAS